jgi:biotin carboxylase
VLACLRASLGWLLLLTHTLASARRRRAPAAGAGAARSNRIQACRACVRAATLTGSAVRASLFCLQDKHAQKHHFAAAGVPVAPFADVDSETALQAAAADFGFPLMLKSKRCAAATSFV